MLGNESIKFKELSGLDWKKDARKIFPPLSTLTLQQTPKTVRVCYFCRGTRFTEIHHTSGKVTIRTCQRCKGEGKVLD